MAGRERNPERSRERIIEAALGEFAAKGFAGARVAAIARRAGLNQQLISHHFGGKLGLYRAVMAQRRRRGGGELIGVPEQMPDALADFFDRAGGDPDWVRVLLWEALEAPEAGAEVAGRDERRARYDERVAWVESEQAAGRLPTDLDPTMLLMTLLGSALYPLLRPDVCEIMTGARPGSPGFDERYRTHLRDFADHLGVGSLSGRT